MFWEQVTEFQLRKNISYSKFTTTTAEEAAAEATSTTTTIITIIIIIIVIIVNFFLIKYFLEDNEGDEYGNK